MFDEYDKTYPIVTGTMASWYRERTNECEKDLQEGKLTFYNYDTRIIQMWGGVVPPVILTIQAATDVSPYATIGFTHGRQLFGLFKDGVLLPVYNHALFPRICESPIIGIKHGVRNRGIDADPWPYPTSGQWILQQDWPITAINRINATIREIITHAITVVRELCDTTEQTYRLEQIAAEKRKAAIIAAWQSEPQEV